SAGGAARRRRAVPGDVGGRAPRPAGPGARRGRPGRGGGRGARRRGPDRGRRPAAGHALVRAAAAADARLLFRPTAAGAGARRAGAAPRRTRRGLAGAAAGGGEGGRDRRAAVLPRPGAGRGSRRLGARAVTAIPAPGAVPPPRVVRAYRRAVLRGHGRSLLRT